ncbi:MAG: hypothetical protein LBK06_04460 [Planctomycetaceae bacterium]|nr:hypothetical protein [Planctomycetaceae bacterium]
MNHYVGRCPTLVLVAPLGRRNTIGFALEQPLHVVALLCSALRILKQLQYTNYCSIISPTFRP